MKPTMKNLNLQVCLSQQQAMKLNNSITTTEQIIQRRAFRSDKVCHFQTSDHVFNILTPTLDIWSTQMPKEKQSKHAGKKKQVSSWRSAEPERSGRERSQVRSPVSSLFFSSIFELSLCPLCGWAWTFGSKFLLDSLISWFIYFFVYLIFNWL